MRQVNCYIPVRVHILGELDEAALQQLAETLSSAVQGRLRFARQSLAKKGFITWQQSEQLDGAIERFEALRWNSEAGTYDIPSYKDRGRRSPMPVRRSSPRIQLTNAIRKDLEAQIQESEIDETFLADPEALAGMRAGLTQWAYRTYFVPEKELTGRALTERMACVERKVVLPVLSERLASAYRARAGEQNTIPIATEAEFYAMPKLIQSAVAGGLEGWLDMWEGLAGNLAKEFQENLLGFYDFFPGGWMVPVEVFPDKEATIVHADLVPALNQIAERLMELSPMLEDRYPRFWQGRSAFGLQIRHIHGSATVSQHALGKAIDLAARENPHVKDPRLLTVMSQLSEMNAQAGLGAYNKRRRLIESNQQRLAEGKESSPEFKEFLLEAKARYHSWIEGQEKYQSRFPALTPGDDLPVKLSDILDRVEEDRERLAARLEEIEADIEVTTRVKNELAEERKAINTRLSQIKKERGVLRSERDSLREVIRRNKKRQDNMEYQELFESKEKLQETETHITALYEGEKAAKARLKEICKLELENNRTAKNNAALRKKQHVQVTFLENLSRDLIRDDALLNRKNVINPGLSKLQQQGFLDIPWEVVQTFVEHGFDWGGFWSGPDFMHFEWVGKVQGEK